MEIEIAASGIYLEPYGVLKDFYRVIREKEAVINAFYNYDTSIERNHEASGSCTLALGVNEIATEIKSLCNYFVDEQESHAKAIPRSYENFPRSLAQRLRDDQEHSIAPDFISQEESFMPESLEKYKRFLANCAYWLNQMYMIEVPFQYGDGNWGDHLQGVTQQWGFIDKDGNERSSLRWNLTDWAGHPEEDKRDYPTKPPVVVDSGKDKWTHQRMRLDYYVQNSRYNMTSGSWYRDSNWELHYRYTILDYGSGWQEGVRAVGQNYTNSTYTGLWVDNRAPFDGVCKCFFVKNDRRRNHTNIGIKSSIDWDSIVLTPDKIDTEEIRNDANQEYEKWEGFQCDSFRIWDGYYLPAGANPELPWGMYARKKTTNDTNNDYWIVTQNGIKPVRKLRREFGYDTAEDGEYAKCNSFHEEDDCYTYSVPDAGRSFRYYHSEKNDDGSGHPGVLKASNDLSMYISKWWGYGFTTDPSIPVEAPLAAHTKDFVIPETNSIELPDPQWDEFNGVVGWKRGSQQYYEYYIIQYDVVVIPIMDYREALTTISVVFPEE